MLTTTQNAYTPPLFDLPDVAESHPARYTEDLIPVFAEMLQDSPSVLDPFGGTGKIFRLRTYGYTGQIHCIEIEPRWAAWHPETQVGNALDLPFDDKSIAAICTSPTYGNRMADIRKPEHDLIARTYFIACGASLHPDNSGTLQWGAEYRDFHEAAWRESSRVLKHGGVFVLNIKDHIRNFERQHVTQWHIDTLQSLGFIVVEHRKIGTPGMRNGKNWELRVPYESVVKLVQA